MSFIEGCPQFRGVLLEGFYCIIHRNLRRGFISKIVKFKVNLRDCKFLFEISTRLYKIVKSCRPLESAELGRYSMYVFIGICK